MWTITVKTLDSQNHKFTDIDPDQSIEALKTIIASKVSVEACRQRLIFCGRVLQDDKKVRDYDVNGRVIHLVQRQPPGSTLGPDRVAESEARASSRGPSPAPRARIEHIHVHSQDIPVPHFLTSPGGAIGQSSPLVRLNVAREMLRQANLNLDRLDNPSQRPESSATESSSAEPNVPAPGPVGPLDFPMADLEEHFHGEVGFAGGPIQIEMMSIPVTGDGMMGVGAAPAGLAEALTAMFGQGMVPRVGHSGGSRSMSFRFENGRPSMDIRPGRPPTTEAGSGTSSSQQQPATGEPAPFGVGPTSGAAAAAPAAGNEVPSEPEPGNGIRHPPPEMLAEVLEEYQRTNARLIAHQNNLNPILRSDAAYPTEAEANAHQKMFNDISRTMHFLSHAQHAMSDIMLNFSRPPPRQLRARLFVIPSLVSARVQTVPISMNLGNVGLARSTVSASTTTSSRPATATAGGAPTVTSSSSTGSSTTTTTADGIRTSTRSTTIPIPGGFGNASITVRASAQQSDLAGGANRRTTNDNINSLVNSAFQQAMRSVPASFSSSSSRRGSIPSSGRGTTQGSGQARQMPMGIPMSPQGTTPVVGNLNSFDPFLPCSSHHIPSMRSPLGGSVTMRNQQRAARSEPSSGVPSRTSSLDRRSTINRSRPTPTNGATWITANTAGSGPPLQAMSTLVSSEPIAAGMNGLLQHIFGPPPGIPNQEDVDVMNMIQGVLGQVVNSLGGGGPQQSPQTIAQFLNSLPEYNYVQGESLISDLLMTLAEHVNFTDLIGIVASNESRLGTLQQPLQRFVRERVLRGSEPTRTNLQSSLTDIMDEWYPQLEEAMAAVNLRDEINYAETAHRFLSERPMDLLNLIMEEDNQSFQSRIGPLLRLITAEGTALSLHCFSDGQESLERLVENRLSALTSDVGPMIRQWTMGSAISHLRGFVTGVHVELDEVRRYIVRQDAVSDYASARASRLAARSPSAAETIHPAATLIEPMQADPLLLPADMEVETTGEVGGTVAPPVAALPGVPSIPAPASTPAFPAALLNLPLVAGQVEPEGWQGAVPPEWVPIIARDSQQLPPRSSPYSDAYMSGQPPKRRKLNNERKPQGDTRNFISDTIQEAVESTGLIPLRGMESIINSATASTILQDAVEEVTSDCIQERLEKDPNFSADRFPSAKHFIKKNK